MRMEKGGLDPIRCLASVHAENFLIHLLFSAVDETYKISNLLSGNTSLFSVSPFMEKTFQIGKLLEHTVRRRTQLKLRTQVLPSRRLSGRKRSPSQ